VPSWAQVYRAQHAAGGIFAARCRAGAAGLRRAVAVAAAQEHNMLGEKIGEGSGKVISQRVLPSPGGLPTMETSFQSTGKLMGLATTETGTYVASLRADGTLFGQGQGIVMGVQGETASWTGQGIGLLQKDGSIKYRGAIYFDSKSPTFSKLTSVAGLFEYEVDAQGHTKGQLFEWK
jgi:hypothetical protein